MCWFPMPRAASPARCWDWARAPTRWRSRNSPNSCRPGTYALGDVPDDFGGANARAGLAARHLCLHPLRQERRATPPKLVLPEGVDGEEISRIAEGGVPGARSRQHAGQRHGAGGTGRAPRAIWPSGMARNVTIIVGDALLKQNFPLIHAVGRGSAARAAPDRSSPGAIPARPR